ncbi:MAG TPA: GNAT family N-acetyltransferase [Oscillospiraceae bacterium]|nr:GNAT family N-acetyltransferase [Oscillospiraceae bacterium]HPF55605.1 GNAT family N-acetyltransferase [Clostridiales bacterium]HPK34618.1 GNAT family N-acetyltransferase [Oscillospiraceae bacterium]HPR74617.1 GNAT family N-acetyltransferase [Oscillospiraceae bacterium]
MTNHEILKHIDDGANFYLCLFGNAEHMETIDTGYYTFVAPKPSQPGITFVFDIRLEHLPVETQREKAAEIRALKMPIWLDLLASDELYKLINGREKVHKQTIDDNDEVYMALLSKEQLPSSKISDDIKIVKVRTAEEFAQWADLTNRLLNGGYPDMHPIFHYPLCQKGLMRCYILYKQEKPAAVAAIMDNKGVDSLEFVATVPELRRMGLAKTVCTQAISDAFQNNAQIITVRAINAAARDLYASLNFKIYNSYI